MGLFDFLKDYVALAHQEDSKGNYLKAAEYLERAYYTKKDSSLLMSAAIRFERGRKYEDMLRCIQEAAKAGNGDAMCWLGELCRDGNIVKQSLILAESYFQCAVAKGCRGAYRQWGLMYSGVVAKHIDGNRNDLPQAVKTDYKRAMEIFMKGHNAGCGDCSNELGLLYIHGKGVPVDEKEAMRYFQIAADRNDRVGCLNLAIAHYEAWNGERNDELAYKYFIKADQLGSSAAQKWLSKDKTKLRSHLEMETKDFAKKMGETVLESAANALVGAVVGGTCEEIIK